MVEGHSCIAHRRSHNWGAYRPSECW